MSTVQLNFVEDEKKFDAVESRKKSIKGNAYNFSVDYNVIDKSDA